MVFKSNPRRWSSTVEFFSDNYKVNRRWTFYYVYHRASPGDRKICFRALNINLVFLLLASPAWDGNWFVLIDFLQCSSISQSQKTISRRVLIMLTARVVLGIISGIFWDCEVIFVCFFLSFKAYKSVNSADNSQNTRLERGVLQFTTRRVSYKWKIRFIAWYSLDINHHYRLKTLRVLVSIEQQLCLLFTDQLNDFSSPEDINN